MRPDSLGVTRGGAAVGGQANGCPYGYRPLSAAESQAAQALGQSADSYCIADHSPSPTSCGPGQTLWIVYPDGNIKTSLETPYVQGQRSWCVQNSDMPPDVLAALTARAAPVKCPPGTVPTENGCIAGSVAPDGSFVPAPPTAPTVFSSNTLLLIGVAVGILALVQNHFHHQEDLRVAP